MLCEVVDSIYLVLAIENEDVSPASTPTVPDVKALIVFYNGKVVRCRNRRNSCRGTNLIDGKYVNINICIRSVIQFVLKLGEVAKLAATISSCCFDEVPA